MTDIAAWQAQADDATQALLKLTERPEVISLAGGLPASEAFPTNAVAEAFETAIRENPSASLQYGPSQGLHDLREAVAQRYRDAGAPSVTAENILITTGSQQGLLLLGMALLNRGDRVALDEPTFMGGFDAWRPMYPDFTGLAWDGDSPSIEAGDRAAADRPPKFAYLLPNFRNPTGETMGAARRRNLIALARRLGMLLLEDNPYGALRYDGTEPPSLLSLDAQNGAAPYDGHVAALGTVSKTLAPALRIGWIVAPARLIKALVLAKQSADLCTASINQLAALHLMRSGAEARSIETARALYRDRRDALLAALDEMAPPGARWTRPEGGMFVWLTLPPGLDCLDLFDRAAANGVGFVPGTAFYARRTGGQGRGCIRLNFTNGDPATLREGVRRMALAMQDLAAAA
ncbi:MAG: PLP-dependent aminotransferase family protein [Alphaproteobacteria bacterium]|nr:PLP-dependent aminotransferase family protein [Alphaproteobacteria bacterium]